MRKPKQQQWWRVPRRKVRKLSTVEALKKERRLNRILGNLYENEIAKARAAANPRITDRGKTIDLTPDEYTEATNKQRRITKPERDRSGRRDHDAD
jgi:hypothetical protein